MLLVWAVGVVPGAVFGQSPIPFAADATCAPHLTKLFAPAVVASEASVGYLVCRSARPLDDLRPSTWPADEASVSEAFAGASPQVRRALALLYGGRRVQVSRGWAAQGETLDSFALIAPPPADSLDRIDAGTLIVRTRIRRRTPGGGGL